MKYYTDEKQLIEALEAAIGDMDDEARDLALAAQAHIASPGDWAKASTETGFDK